MKGIIIFFDELRLEKLISFNVELRYQMTYSRINNAAGKMLNEKTFVVSNFS